MTRRRLKVRKTVHQSGPSRPVLFGPIVERLGLFPDPTLAKQAGVTTYRIRKEREARGILAFVSGGRRAGSGFDPVLGPGQARDRIKTVRLSAGEEQAQLEAAKRAGAKDWGTWIRNVGNAAAAAFRGAGSTEYRTGDLLEKMQTAGVTSIVYDDPPEAEPGA